MFTKALRINRAYFIIDSLINPMLFVEKIPRRREIELISYAKDAPATRESLLSIDG